jgi:signal transduction histidine kinase
LDALQTPCEAGEEACARTRSDFAIVHAAVRDALSDLRAISSGLRLPELERLSVAEVVLRAIDDHHRRSRVSVEHHLANVPEHAPLAIKIALLRTLQEALSNATRHGKGARVRVDLTGESDTLWLAVADQGPGFDPERLQHSGQLGIAGMRERAELLGGSFEIRSVPGSGTCVSVSWPLSARAAV